MVVQNGMFGAETPYTTLQSDFIPKINKLWKLHQTNITNISEPNDKIILNKTYFFFKIRIDYIFQNGLFGCETPDTTLQ